MVSFFAVSGSVTGEEAPAPPVSEESPAPPADEELPPLPADEELPPLPEDEELPPLPADEEPSTQSSTPSGEVYIFRAGDDLQVTVAGRDDLNRKVQIREDGTFSFPLIGNIQAAGQTATQLEQEIREKLKASLPAKKIAEIPDSTAVVKPSDIPQNLFYLLQVGDELEISVWEQKDLATKAQIRENGTFSFPLIGNIRAANRSLQEIEKEVQERLDKDFIVNPQVTARLSGAKFTMLGEVTTPGLYNYEGTVDLLSAISQAGGVTKAASNQADIIRDQSGKKLSIRMNLDAVFRGTETNLTILPRDAIMIYPQAAPIQEELEVVITLIDAKFTVLGEVERPGSYPMQNKVDVLTAISQAGGLTKFGSNRGIEIIRTRNNEKVRIRVNLDRVIQGDETNTVLLPHDTVYVKRRLF